MREIKFIAWDGSKIQTEFCIDSSDGMIFTEHDNGGDIAGCCGEYKEWAEYHDDWKLMQYTGLKDKNGVEIYEGYIVSIKSVSNWKNLDNSKLEYYVVTFEDGAFTLYGRSHYVTTHSEEGEDGYDIDASLLYDIDTEREVEVVGNKYQNPELLKKVP